jgi:hypothetical protein
MSERCFEFLYEWRETRSGSLISLVNPQALNRTGNGLEKEVLVAYLRPS